MRRLSVSPSTFAATTIPRRRLEHEWPEFLARVPSLGPNVVVDARPVAALDAPVESTEVVVTRTGSDSCFQRRDFILHWSPSSRAAKLSYTRPFSLSAGLRVLLAMALRSEGGVLFHASSVRVADEAPWRFGYRESRRCDPRGSTRRALGRDHRREDGDESSCTRPILGGHAADARGRRGTIQGDCASRAWCAAVAWARRTGRRARDAARSRAPLRRRGRWAREEKAALFALVNQIVARSPCRRATLRVTANPWGAASTRAARLQGWADGQAARLHELIVARTTLGIGGRTQDERRQWSEGQGGNEGSSSGVARSRRKLLYAAPAFMTRKMFYAAVLCGKQGSQGPDCASLPNAS